MDQIVKIVHLTTNQILITELAEIAAVVPGEPDCKMINPFTIKEDQTLEPWLLNVTKDDIFMISSDKILTLADPTPTLLEKYIDRYTYRFHRSQSCQYHHTSYRTHGNLVQCLDEFLQLLLHSEFCILFSSST